MRRLADLREILRYVPQYRDRLFVIAVDGVIVEDTNFRNLLLDIALLTSLRIGVVLVHGAGHQVDRFAQRLGKVPSNVDGTGVTDADTMDLALIAANRVTHELLEGLIANDLRGAASNAVVAHPAGILRGVDHMHTGRVERIDSGLLQALLASQIIPVVPPLGCDGEGHTFRLNSDTVAVEVATALNAVKLIYLTAAEGIQAYRERSDSETELIRQMTVDEAERWLKEQPERVLPAGLSKLQNGVRAARRGVPRIHIIDGRDEEGLLAEVFSNAGAGTLIHTNEYQAIRQARPKDVRAIYSLVQIGMENDELMRRSRAEIERQIGDYYVFEIDGMPAGCVALHWYPEERKCELASLCVHPSHENQHIGRRLMTYIESRARELGAAELYCLSTQAFNYFLQKGGYHIGTPDDLPAPRRALYDKSGRRSLVLKKSL
jgi:amino-acid N-acetyltransferase